MEEEFLGDTSLSSIKVRKKIIYVINANTESKFMRKIHTNGTSCEIQNEDSTRDSEIHSMAYHAKHNTSPNKQELIDKDYSQPNTNKPNRLK